MTDWTTNLLYIFTNIYKENKYISTKNILQKLNTEQQVVSVMVEK